MGQGGFVNLKVDGTHRNHCDFKGEGTTIPENAGGN
jgi:hypothetical protein